MDENLIGGVQFSGQQVSKDERKRTARSVASGDLWDFTSKEMKVWSGQRVATPPFASLGNGLCVVLYIQKW